MGRETVINSGDFKNRANAIWHQRERKIIKEAQNEATNDNKYEPSRTKRCDKISAIILDQFFVVDFLLSLFSC